MTRPAEGVSRGEFRRVDPDRYAARLRALLDGLSIHVVIGPRGTDRPRVLAHAGEFLAEALLADVWTHARVVLESAD